MDSRRYQAALASFSRAPPEAYFMTAAERLPARCMSIRFRAQSVADFHSTHTK